MNNGGLTSFILNKFDNYVQCWVMTPKVDVAVTRQGHVKIITEPDWIAENKQFREFLIQTINIHAT